ncbi:protocadherin beta-16-like isoform X10 [Hemicordylus capensis]|uniref:protocadherin beta-16-like isoform X10 n=1 Tax=Hemicordylus capensis TaxID=884348 RepID=UPI0023030BC3|nr:protocadherin beta-16-like isoform X10 [Hemicordylus capensis]
MVCGSIHYTVPEERKSGFLVANVLKDLKLDIKELSARRAHLVSENIKQYFQLDPHSGNVVIKERTDREALCERNDPCMLQSEIVLENPLELHRMEIQIEDVNDNAPTFSKNEIILEMSEQIPINTRFLLERAHDPDIGSNGVQSYKLSSNEHFELDVHTRGDGSKYAELVLNKSLDREQEAEVMLILTAADGGIPQRTGTAQVHIIILDTNDNVPQFSQSVYKVKVIENSLLGTLVAKVEASDLDQGPNAKITYSFIDMPAKLLKMFQLDQNTGEVRVSGLIDYEEGTMYEMDIKASDGGGFSGHCKLLIEVVDQNDNDPEVIVTSITNPLPEDSPPETVVALISVIDPDSGDNGRATCSIETTLPFALKPTLRNYYQLVTQRPLDREKISEYNITVTATDWGSPRLTSMRTINIQISDVNDNSPVFEKSLYELQLKENNIPGLLMGSVHAIDLDTEQNAKVIYSLLPGKISDGLVSSYVSINSETGNLYVLRSLDYEQIKHFHVTVRASDGISSSLSSEAIVHVVIMDENDNAPFILYPLQNMTSSLNDLVPRSAKTGYRVTKFVAVDGDSGQNSWLFYQLLKATDPSLFMIDEQNGELKTLRPITERDTFKQRIIVIVRDNGHPPQSSTATLNILLVNGYSDPYLKFTDIPKKDVEEDDNLTMYLVIGLAVISFIFLVFLVLLIAIKIHKSRASKDNYICALPTFPAEQGSRDHSWDVGAGSLRQGFHYDVCLTGGSLSRDFRFLRPMFPVLSTDQPNSQANQSPSEGSKEFSHSNEERDSMTQARASVSEDSAPRSGGPGCTVNQATGAIVNSGQNDWLSYQ